MRIRCLHGYFIFEEQAAGELSRFMQLFEMSIVPSTDHFTFEALVDAPTHAIAGGTYLDAPVTVTIEGKPWEIMRANSLIYNFITGTVVAISSIVKRLEISQAANFYLSPGLILPGSVTDDGLRVTEYSAFFLPDSQRFKYSEVLYE